MSATAGATSVAYLIHARRQASAELDSKLSPTLRVALGHVPSAQRETAARIGVMLQMGYKDMEIASVCRITWRTLEGIRVQMRTGIVESHRSDGYSDEEIQRTLLRGVTTASAVVNELRAQTGEDE